MASSILKDRRLSFKQGLYSQVIAGMVARTLTAPLDVVKINMQVATFQSSNAGMFGTYTNILRDEGTVLALWKGNFSSCLKIIPHTYIQISTFQHFKQKMADDMGKLNTEKAMKAGAMAGLAATIFTYPLDTIKTRLVCYPFEKSRSPHRGVFSGLYDIVKLEGVRKLYSGLLPTLVGKQI
ncbi:hypothetical protein CHS0354_027951 [Potamilus streckersoni]|uniref:Uncharacterized protein n=1 Tax=Potamilus streckersoni TaxID=2493646 RepID=A0AAE0T490_9BIVA|nr:hypothetical protein CHS0354_027951 [Potamilus streckersoni]